MVEERPVAGNEVSPSMVEERSVADNMGPPSMVEERPVPGLGICLEESVDERHKFLFNRTPPKEHLPQESDGASINDEGMNANENSKSSSKEDGLNTQESKKNSDKNESNDGPIPESMFGLPIMLSNLFTEGHVATGPGVVDLRTAQLPKSPFKVSSRHGFKKTDEGSKKPWGNREDEDEDDSSNRR
jgi:hypothetical protein